MKIPSLITGRWYAIVEFDDDSWIQLFNWLSPELRYIGPSEYYHDGPIPSFGFYFFNVAYKR